MRKVLLGLAVIGALIVSAGGCALYGRQLDNMRGIPQEVHHQP